MFLKWSVNTCFVFFVWNTTLKIHGSSNVEQLRDSWTHCFSFRIRVKNKHHTILGKESYHILPGQIFSAFQTGFPPTALKQCSAISVQWRSPSSVWMHASVCFSLCTSSLRANYIYTVQRSSIVALWDTSPTERQMLRSDYEALNCDLAGVCSEHTEFTESLKSARAHLHIVQG